jgi:hypothetical protein
VTKPHDFGQPWSSQRLYLFGLLNGTHNSRCFCVLPRAFCSAGEEGIRTEHDWPENGTARTLLSLDVRKYLVVRRGGGWWGRGGSRSPAHFLVKLNVAEG